VFHVAEGGLPIPDDKKAVPLRTFALLLRAALQPPANCSACPSPPTSPSQAECFVSLLLRPTVVPAVPGRGPAQSMEIRFFAPGNLVPTWTSSRASSATPAIRSCPKTTPASTPTIGPGTAAA
jgi:hypothetical protein